jgi:hypothetical protein
MVNGFPIIGISIDYSPFTIHYSQVIPGIPLCRPDILPNISPESQYHVDDNRRAHRQDRSVHEILPDLACSNTHPVANGCTNAKSVPFNKAFEFVHSSNIKKMNHSANQELFRPLIFVLSQQFTVSKS